MVKSLVKIQHYDVDPGTEVFKIKISTPETNMYGVPYWLVTIKEDIIDPAADTLRTIPEYKLEDR